MTVTQAQFFTMVKNLIFEEKRLNVYIDDLDRGWENSKDDIKDKSALLNAVRDLSRECSNLRFRIGLRSDVYYAVRTSDETTDKIDGSVIWQKWTNQEILVMLIKRIETYFGRTVNEEELMKQKSPVLNKYLITVFEGNFRGQGQWNNAPIYRVLMSLIRKRPRDLVKLCTLAARNARENEHSRILTSDLTSVFQSYSNDRLTDTSTEYRSEFPQLMELLLKMRPSVKEIKQGTPCLYSSSELIIKLKNVLSMSSFAFKNGRPVTPQNLAVFLYKINFLTARKELDDGTVLRFYYDENRYISNEFTDFGYSFEIHPAYRWALQPNNADKLYSHIVLSADEKIPNEKNKISITNDEIRLKNLMNLAILKLDSMIINPKGIIVFGGKNVKWEGNEAIPNEYLPIIRRTALSSSIINLNGKNSLFINLCEKDVHIDDIGLILNLAYLNFKCKKANIRNLYILKVYSMINYDKSFTTNIRIDAQIQLNNDSLILPISYACPHYEMSSMNLASISHIAKTEEQQFDLLKVPERAGEIISFIETGYLIQCILSDNKTHILSLIIDRDMKKGGRLNRHYFYAGDEVFEDMASKAIDKAGYDVVVSVK